jgi:bifunctional non-homologous end joining protein LigD
MAVSVATTKQIPKQTHPSALKAPKAVRNPPIRPIQIAGSGDRLELSVAGHSLLLTNLNKLFWTKEKITKADLLEYYADIAPVLLPHLVERAMVMKRYPDGADGPFFFQKHAPKPCPEWVPICEILHPSANLVDFPVVSNLGVLLWIVNLG